MLNFFDFFGIFLNKIDFLTFDRRFDRSDSPRQTFHAHQKFCLEILHLQMVFSGCGEVGYGSQTMVKNWYPCKIPLILTRFWSGNSTKIFRSKKRNGRLFRKSILVPKISWRQKSYSDPKFRNLAYIQSYLNIRTNEALVKWTIQAERGRSRLKVDDLD